MPLKAAYARLTGADANIAPEEPKNGLLHVAALTLTKVADSLIDPKLVLAWLLTSLGAPGMIIGALVPVREAGALLPQLLLARRVEAAPRTKIIWATSAALQGLAALAIATSVVLLEGAAAGWAVLAALAVLAAARAGASVSYKDVLARTIPTGRRGSITGFAAASGSLAAFAFGLAMALGLLPLARATLAAAVAAAGLAFLTASLLFRQLEEPKAEEGAAPMDLAALIAPLTDDRQLQRFIIARALLTVTALAPPFIIMLAGTARENSLAALGPLVMASTAASVMAAYVWGRLSDRSSRNTLVAAGLLSAVALAVIALIGLSDASLGGRWGAAAAIFAAQIAYEGVRQGRKLHLTDMTTDSQRARYTALSNSLIGTALLIGGGAGFVADRIGPAPLLLAFAAMALVGALVAVRLTDVQQD
ncbi:MAG: hypothetical protein ACMVO5_01060 [Polymorphobacter sp.]|uniref:hypothetical protein n=1 Tax=Polymorphobacter sp. TaxID=1909290 RepID=UPI003A8776E1